MNGRVAGQRVILTQADVFMGPAIRELFETEGASVVADTRDLATTGAAQALINEAGSVDILVANLMLRNPRHLVPDTPDSEWLAMFDAMVHPLHWLVRAVLPQMIARRRGKIVVIGSANALRGTSPRAAYGAARGAQLAYVRNAGIEVAPHGININAVAQNFVSNPTSYTPDILASAEFQAKLKDVPVGRAAHGWESAAVAMFLASGESDFLHGQIVPFAGGWVV